MAGGLFFWSQGRWWKRGWRRWGPVGTAYLLTLAAIMVVLVWPFPPRVVPALATQGSEGGAAFAVPTLSSIVVSVMVGGIPAARELWTSPQIPLGKWALGGALPPCPTGSSPHDEPGWGEVGSEFFCLVSGIRLNSPASWLSLPGAHGKQVFPPEEEYVALPPSAFPGSPSGVGNGLPAELRGQILVGLYTTHTRESYLPALGGSSDPDQAHSIDPSRNMLRVAEELARTLSERYGIGVVLSRNVHDRTGKLGAYQRSLPTAQALLREYPSVRFLFDIHRDSTRRDATICQVAGKPAARIMIVLGSRSEVGPGWDKNKALADRVAALMEERYPGLLRRILVANARYNQHLSSGALLFEMGGVDNTLEEATYSAQLLADVLHTVIGEELARGR